MSYGRVTPLGTPAAHCLASTVGEAAAAGTAQRTVSVKMSVFYLAGIVGTLLAPQFYNRESYLDHF